MGFITGQTHSRGHSWYVLMTVPKHREQMRKEGGDISWRGTAVICLESRTSERVSLSLSKQDRDKGELWMSVGRSWTGSKQELFLLLQCLWTTAEIILRDINAVSFSHSFGKVIEVTQIILKGSHSELPLT